MFTAKTQNIDVCYASPVVQGGKLSPMVTICMNCQILFSVSYMNCQILFSLIYMNCQILFSLIYMNCQSLFSGNEIFFLFSPENRFWNFIQTTSNGDGLHEDKSCFLRKYWETICMNCQILFSGKSKVKCHKFVVCWISHESDNNSFLASVVLTDN